MMKIVKTNRAFTLIEITLVLGLTLGLASALIFGLSAFNRGADRAKCVLQMANVQKAVRSLQNMNEFRPGDTSELLKADNLWGTPDAFLAAKPICPRASSDQNAAGDLKNTQTGNVTGKDGYAYHVGGSSQFPELGTGYINCVSKTDSTTYKHVPKDVDGILSPK